MRVGVLVPTRGVVMQSARRPPVDECWSIYEGELAWTDEVFDPGAYLRNAGEVFERLEALKR